VPRPETGSGKASIREIWVGDTQEFWGELHEVRQEQRDLRATLDSRATKTETALERLRSETRDEIKSSGARMEDLLARMRSEIRDDLKTMEKKLDLAVDKVRTELAEDITLLRDDTKEQLRELSGKMDRHRSESAREAKGSTRWALGTVIVAVFTMVTMAATVVVALITRVH
jgi:uncharacterized FlaG/YvyC family protein